ncbi:phosphoesterase family-domain-containing protein [Polychytrium aggregatum]|uniref:phosphoesterase family-domain-containing protein n=1 Tax=Polychytrium aggregatum TaxID=110093 RepID=UPI0022FE3946|nr:phosphoesterase family-domain-containing protein [Polychytrium aggregatum]KAI9201878.1 phosphoesterase family-domain-containing protein [Polychytrium aggregatum]
MIAKIALSVLALAASAQAAYPQRWVTVLLENTNYASAMADPYLGTNLTARGQLLTNYQAITHPSQPNYVALIGGSTLGVTSDSTVNLAYTSLVDLLEAKFISWKTYQDAMPSACYTGSTSGTYARKHNPFISFNDVRTNSTRCAKIVPATQMAVDEANNAVPKYVFYTPDLNNDGHDTGVTYASNWLKGWLEPKLANPIYANTLFAITFDENAGITPNQVYTLLIGGPANAKKGTTDGTAYNHYSLLKSVEDTWSLGNLGRGDATATRFSLMTV